MDTSSRFIINLDKVPAEGLNRSWHLDEAFFSALDEQEIERGKLDATLRVTKASGAYEFHFQVEGYVEVPCDRCLEPMQQPIIAEDTIKVVLGSTLEDDGDQITVPADKPEVDVAWNLYETIALAIPSFHAHENGNCNTEMTGWLNELEPVRPQNDSRWDTLRDLL
ncbi:MAG: DUF177 domain-containing protein [Bacteroidaceae bacterium]|nr:DUF177 domain-containing protein [Bacteroidaceae bacterium]